MHIFNSSIQKYDIAAFKLLYSKNHLSLCLDLNAFLCCLLLAMDNKDVSIWSSSLVGSRDNFSLINASKSKPLPLSTLSASDNVCSSFPFNSVFCAESGIFPNGSCSKFKSLFMLSSAGSMMSRNPFTQEASSTTSVRCRNRKHYRIKNQIP